MVGKSTCSISLSTHYLSILGSRDRVGHWGLLAVHLDRFHERLCVEGTRWRVTTGILL